MPDDTTEPWNGRHLDLPAHIHVPELGSQLSTSAAVRHTAFEFEFLLIEGSGIEGSGDAWVLNRERSIVVPLARAIRRCAWGLATVVPEVVLFYKAGGDLTAAEIESHSGRIRPRDEQDFRALLPILAAEQRHWLRESLASVWPGHQWLPYLGG